jgi:hypothetical protein
MRVTCVLVVCASVQAVTRALLLPCRTDAQCRKSVTAVTLDGKPRPFGFYSYTAASHARQRHRRRAVPHADGPRLHVPGAAVQRARLPAGAGDQTRGALLPLEVAPGWVGPHRKEEPGLTF